MPNAIKNINFLSGQMATANKDNKEEIIDNIKTIVANFAENGLNEEELINLKRKAQNKIDFYFKNNEAILGALMFLHSNDLLNTYYDKLQNEIDKIDLLSINKFCKEFIRSNEMTFVIY